MKRRDSFIAIVVLFSIISGLFFFENIKGYYHFKQYCAKEGGLKVYEPLEKNMGWWANDQYEAQVASQLKGVRFVRYSDKKDGQMYDLYYLGGDYLDKNSFRIESSNAAVEVKYKWMNVSIKINGEVRLTQFGYEARDYLSNKLLAQYYTFKYEKFDREKMLLDMPSKIFCPSIENGAYESSEKWKENWNSIFN